MALSIGRSCTLLILSHAVEVRVALDQTSFGQFRYACWLSGSFSPAWDGPQPNGAPQHRYDWGRLPLMKRVNARCRQKRTLIPPLQKSLCNNQKLTRGEPPPQTFEPNQC